MHKTELFWWWDLWEMVMMMMLLFVDFWVLILKHFEEERKLFLYHVLMIETGLRRAASRFFSNPCLITPFPTDHLL